MKTDFIYDRATIVPIQESTKMDTELGVLRKVPNEKRIRKRSAKRRQSKQRKCICCLLILLLLLVTAVYVAAWFFFRTCSCEMTNKYYGRDNSSLDVHTTSIPLSTHDISAGMPTAFSRMVYLSTEDQRTSTRLSAQNITAGSRGRSFLVLFTTNGFETKKNIYVTSENGTQINITTSSRLDASLKIEIDRSVHIPSSKRIILPQGIELQTFEKEVKSVLIETSSDVFVISHDDGKDSVGSTTHIPLHKLSTTYVAITTKPAPQSFSQIAVAAIEDNTTISIIFRTKHTFPVIIGGNMYYNGDAFNFSLDRFETYQIEHDADLTGTFIKSSAPIAAFSGNDCNELENIGACDHLIEQLPPTDSVDKTYIVPPNSDDRDTLIRFTAIENSNISYIIDSVTQTISLDRFNYFDTHISSSQSCFIESNVPLLVTSIGLGSKRSDTAMGDPSMTIVPGINQYLDYYKIVVPSGYDKNYVSIMIKFAYIDSFRLNRKIINKRDIVFEENVSAGNATYNVRTCFRGRTYCTYCKRGTFRADVFRSFRIRSVRIFWKLFAFVNGVFPCMFLLNILKNSSLYEPYIEQRKRSILCELFRDVTMITVCA